MLSVINWLFIYLYVAFIGIAVLFYIQKGLFYCSKVENVNIIVSSQCFFLKS